MMRPSLSQPSGCQGAAGQSSSSNWRPPMPSPLPTSAPASPSIRKDNMRPDPISLTRRGHDRHQSNESKTPIVVPHSPISLTAPSGALTRQSSCAVSPAMGSAVSFPISTNPVGETHRPNKKKSTSSEDLGAPQANVGPVNQSSFFLGGGYPNRHSSANGLDYLEGSIVSSIAGHHHHHHHARSSSYGTQLTSASVNATPVVNTKNFTAFRVNDSSLSGGLRSFCCWALFCFAGETNHSMSSRLSRATPRVQLVRLLRFIILLGIIYTVITQRRLFLSVPLQLSGQCPFGAVLERSDMGKLYKAASKSGGIRSSTVPPETSLSPVWGLDWRGARSDSLPAEQLTKLSENGVRLASMRDLMTRHLRAIRSDARSVPEASRNSFRRWSQWELLSRRDDGVHIQMHTPTLDMDLAVAVKEYAFPFPLQPRLISYTLNTTTGRLAVHRLMRRRFVGELEGLTESDETWGEGLFMYGGEQENATDRYSDELRLIAYLQQRERSLWWRSVRALHDEETAGRSRRVAKGKPLSLNAESRSEKMGFDLGRYSFTDMFNPRHILSPGIWRRHKSLQYHSKIPFEVVDAAGVPIYERYLQNADNSFRLEDDAVDVQRVDFRYNGREVESLGTIRGMRNLMENATLRKELLADVPSDYSPDTAVRSVTVSWKKAPFFSNQLRHDGLIERVDEKRSVDSEIGGASTSSSSVVGRWFRDIGKAIQNFHGLRFHVRSENEQAEIERADRSLREISSSLQHATVSNFVDDGQKVAHTAHGHGVSVTLRPIPNVPIPVEHVLVAERESRQSRKHSALRAVADSKSMTDQQQDEIIRRLARSAYVVPIQERKIPLVIVQTNQNTVVPEGIKTATERLLKDNPEFSYEFFSDHDMDAFVSLYFGHDHMSADEEALGPEEAQARKVRQERAQDLDNSLLTEEFRSTEKGNLSRASQISKGLIADAYFSLIPGAFRADLFRYLYLFLFGGVYIDMGMSPPTAESYAPFSAYRDFCQGHHENAKIQRLWSRDFLRATTSSSNAEASQSYSQSSTPSGKRAAHRRKQFLSSGPREFCPGPLFSLLRPEDTFVSAEDSGEGLVYNAFMMSAPAHPIMKAAIVMAVNRIHSRYWVPQTKHNNAALSVTGPKLLAEAFLEVTRRAPESNKHFGRGIRLVSYWRFNACLSGAIEADVDVRAEVMSYENRDLLEYSVGDNADDGILQNALHEQSLVVKIPDALNPDVQRSRTLLFTKYDTYYHDSRFYHTNPHYGILYDSKRIYKKRNA